MPWIKIVEPQDAVGMLKTVYDNAIRRAGKVFHILSIQSRRPKALHHSTQLYMEMMRSAEGALTRPQREMIATVVSQVNGCHY